MIGKVILKKDVTAKKYKRVILFSCLLGILILVIFSLLIWYHQPKNKVFRAIGKTALEWQEAEYQTQAGTTWLETISNAITGDASGDFSLNLSGIQGVDYTLGLDGKFARNMQEKQLGITFNTSVSNYPLAQIKLFAKEDTTYFSIPEFFDGVLTIPNLTAGKEWNNSTWCDLTGEMLPDEFKLNWFIGEGKELRSNEIPDLFSDAKKSLKEIQVGKKAGEKEFQNESGESVLTSQYPVTLFWREQSIPLYIYLDKKDTLIALETQNWIDGEEIEPSSQVDSLQITFLKEEGAEHTADLELKMPDGESESMIQLKLIGSSWTNILGVRKPEMKLIGNIVLPEINVELASTIRNSDTENSNMEGSDKQDSVRIELQNLVLKEDDEKIAKLTGTVDVTKFDRVDGVLEEQPEGEEYPFFNMTLWDLIKNERLLQLLDM